MSPMPFADAFQTGAVLTLALPIGLVLAIVLWYVLDYKRVPAASTDAATLPPREMVAAAGPEVVADHTLERDVTPVDQDGSTPADRPAGEV
jgi:hypothetical protein